MTGTLTRIDGKLVPFNSRHNPKNNAILRWMKQKPFHARSRRLIRPQRSHWKIRAARSKSQHTTMLTLRRAKRRMKSKLTKVMQRITGQRAKYRS